MVFLVKPNPSPGAPTQALSTASDCVLLLGLWPLGPAPGVVNAPAPPLLPAGATGLGTGMEAVRLLREAEAKRKVKREAQAGETTNNAPAVKRARTSTSTGAAAAAADEKAASVAAPIAPLPTPVAQQQQRPLHGPHPPRVAGGAREQALRPARSALGPGPGPSPAAPDGGGGCSGR